MMYTCEYDYTMPVSRDYITELANSIYPGNLEVECELYVKMEQEFWSGDLEHIKMNQHYSLNDTSFMFCHKGRRWFTIVVSPGLNGETWYYGVLPLRAQVMGIIKGGEDA